MNVLIDTSVWSLALRRTSQTTHPCAKELRALIREDRVVMTGVIRQELLSGIKDKDQFAILRDRLRAFPDLVAETEDFERAAEFYNKCRLKESKARQLIFFSAQSLSTMICLSFQRMLSLLIMRAFCPCNFTKYVI